VDREDGEDVTSEVVTLRRAFEAELVRMAAERAPPSREEEEKGSAIVSAFGRWFEALLAQMAADTAPARHGREGGLALVLPDSKDEVAALGRAFAATRNPLYVWEALTLLCIPPIVGTDAPDCLLPGWCAAYLGRVAEVFMGLPPPGIDPEGGMAEQAPAVSKALGLSRQGWDAYADWQRDRARERDADLYHRVKALGIPDKDAMEAAIEVFGLEDARSVRHRLHRARRTRPRPTKPAP
jgi:hypothetical protein